MANLQTLAWGAIRDSARILSHHPGAFDEFLFLEERRHACDEVDPVDGSNAADEGIGSVISSVSARVTPAALSPISAMSRPAR
jgi:hypothetical protein